MTTDRLSALDAAFVTLDRRSSPFEVGGVLVFDRAPLLTEIGEIDADRVAARVEEVIADLPRYRQRLRRRPALIGGPRWVDDPHFALANHLCYAALPAPGGDAVLDAWVGSLFSAPLPADRPPWQLWCVDDPAADRVALVAKVHHALLDGIAGVRVLDRLLTTGSADRHDAPAPSRHLEPTRPPARVLARAASDLLGRALHPAPDVGLDAPSGGGMHTVARFELPMDLDALKARAKSDGVSVNDLLLAIVAGALRRTLQRRCVPTARLGEVRAMIPVNTRAADDAALTGNDVALLLVGLPVDEADPAARVARVHREAVARREAHEIEAGAALVRLADATTPWVLSGLLRIGLARRAFNLVITNIPGPTGVRRFLGARLRAFHPIVNLWPGQSLGLAFTSCGGKIEGSVHALERTIDDLAPIVDDLRRVSGELEPGAPA